MKVRCGYTSCKNNKQKKDGYFCTKAMIELFSYSRNNSKTRMICDQYRTKKNYATAKELITESCNE